MAALSAATVVVEAGARSGSMKVAQEAHQLGRALGAVPGPVTSVTSVGPNDLLAEGVARMVRYAGDVTIRGKATDVSSISQGGERFFARTQTGFPWSRGHETRSGL